MKLQKNLPLGENFGSSYFKNIIKSESISSDTVRLFQKTIYEYYEKHARHYPWRIASTTPYHILISEIMLQQTQTNRVIKKYKQFTKTFPDFSSLAHAKLYDIITVWQGLGYNRRALALKTIAETIIDKFGGVLPSNINELITLPGIGKYSASAICTFAFNQPHVFIETNIRTVFIHFFFNTKTGVKDKDLLLLVKQTLDTSNPRKWYYALMDYGEMLKKKYPNPNRRSAHYRKQSAFKDSNRQIRGLILRVLTKETSLSENEMINILNLDSQKIKHNLIQLQREGFIKKKGKEFSLV